MCHSAKSVAYCEVNAFSKPRRLVWGHYIITYFYINLHAFIFIYHKLHQKIHWKYMNDLLHTIWIYTRLQLNEWVYMMFWKGAKETFLLYSGKCNTWHQRWRSYKCKVRYGGLWFSLVTIQWIFLHWPIQHLVLCIILNILETFH